MKGGYDLSVSVTTTRGVLVSADPSRVSLRVSAPLTNSMFLSTRAATGSGGFLLRPGQTSEVFKLG